MRLLERYQQKATRRGARDREVWKDVTFNGKPRPFPKWWRINVEEGGSFGWRKEVADIDPSSSVTSNWRVPLKHVVTFTLWNSSPQHVLSDHYNFDLSDPGQRRIAESLRVHALLIPGQNWWQAFLDYDPFELRESAFSHPKNTLPNHGILRFDYVVLRPKAHNVTMKSMVQCVSCMYVYHGWIGNTVSAYVQ